jgi:hypothetical protein
MVVYESWPVFGSCVADHVLLWAMILVLWSLFLLVVYLVRRRRGSAVEITAWRWIGGGFSLLLVALAAGLALTGRQTVRVVTIDRDVDIVGCAGVSREAARLPLSEIRVEYWSHGPSSHRSSSSVVHEFQVWTLGKSRQLARFPADSRGTNLDALRKLAPDAVADYERTRQ